jgi:hypothetical protein
VILIVLDAGVSTGHGLCSHSLSTLIHGYSLRDAWQARPGNTAYTHYTVHGATRLDHFYLTEGLLRRKTGVATLAAAFTDHFEVVLCLSMGAPLLQWGQGTWKLRSDTLNSTHVLEDLQHNWMQWKKQHLYPNINLWWSCHCKNWLRKMFQRMEAERRRDLHILENFYYDCIYALVSLADGNPSTSPALRHLNTKIVRLHAKRLQSSMSDTAPADNIPGEMPTLYQLICKYKWRSS